MEQMLAEVTLKSGEPMQVIKVVGPAPGWEDRILPFLLHKGDPWLWQMRNAIGEGLGGGAAHNFYEGVLEGATIVGNIATVEAHERPIGLLQHVFTPEEQRRKGIASAIMAALCADFRARDGRVMYLHTGHDTPPFHIYESFGFVGHEDTGAMSWTLDDGFRHEYYMPAETTVHDTDWQDWTPLEALSWTVGGATMRSFYLRKYGFGGFEGEYVQLRKQQEEGQVREFKVLRTREGAVVGYAFLARLRSFPGNPWGMDAFIHPHFCADAGKLIGAIELPDDAPVLAFSDLISPDKNAALEAAGLTQCVAVPGLLTSHKGEPVEMRIYSGS